tara:strand:+ start:918 stop:2882 length:1965 start_codon:yes stop_codon:yes gene_type:complete
MLKLVKVVLDIPLNEAFDYISDDRNLKIGSRVRVPFGKSTRLGIIIDIKPVEHTKKEYKIKRIGSLVDLSPIISKEMMTTCKWASSYYHHPIGQVIFAAITPYLRKENKEPKTHLKILERKVDVDLNLNDEQNKIYLDVLKKRNEFNVNVIRGVTGSGKTELYTKLSQELISKGGQVLIMVPEINLIPQTIERFRRYINIEPVQYHSNLTIIQKYKIWNGCVTENKFIVIGTRSSVFLPFNNLKLVVVDEEHDSSYKQTEMFKYNARDIGILRANHFNCPVILGSATPSFETTHNVNIAKYTQYKIEKRFHKSKLPLIRIIDSSIDRPDEGITNTLKQHMEDELRKNKKIILFLGRRGFSDTVICSNCKKIVKCPKCDTYLTYHKNIEKLICHKCEFKRNYNQIDKCCDNPQMSPLGIGTQRIENKIKQLFPNKNILRVDSDNISSKKDLDDFINKANNGEIDVFVGTQMIVKGHDFTDVSLVGIINIDAGLYSTDFRGLEKTAQLITQVSGRSGRQKEQGNVLIQTHNPNHEMLQLVLKEGYVKFSSTALEERKAVNLPPFSHIALVKVASNSRAFTKTVLSNTKTIDRKKTVFIYGPSQSKIVRKNNQYQYQVLVGSNSPKLLSEHISKIEIYLSSLNKKIKWHIDVDPLEL